MFSSINSLFYATRVAHANYLIEQLLVVLGIVLVLIQLLDQSLLPLLALLQRVPVLYVLPHVGFRLEQLYRRRTVLVSTLNAASKANGHFSVRRLEWEYECLTSCAWT